MMKRTNSRTKNLLFRATEEIHDKLVDVAREDQTSVQELLDEITSSFLERRTIASHYEWLGKILSTKDRNLIRQVDVQLSKTHRLLESLVSTTMLDLLRTLADSPMVTIVVKDMEAKIKWANEAFEHAVGLSLSHLKGKDFSEISKVDKKYGRWITDMDREIIKLRQPKVLLGPIIGRRGGGFRATLNMPAFGDDGGVHGIVVIGLSLGKKDPKIMSSEYKEITSDDMIFAFDKSMIWTSVFVDSLSAAAVVKTKDLKIVWVNKEYEAMTGMKLQSIRGKSVGEIWADSVSACLIEENDRAALKTRDTTVRMERVFRATKAQSSQTRRNDEKVLSPQVRLRIRFPIQLPDGTLLLGALGFDANKIQNQINKDIEKIKRHERELAKTLPNS